ncbi:MAG TPA: ATP-binding protein [Xanthobacteraceae bacterium]|nr:ATP-binding protein [Xanthobacteraceae bacterium]
MNDVIGRQPVALPSAGLPVTRLYRPADLSALPFASTAEIEPIEGLVGQGRALDAIQFGTRIAKPGFNLFVIGPFGAGMKPAVEAALKDTAAARPSPSDWVYVNNFAEPHKPVAIELPAGRAVKFRDAMHALIDDLKVALPAVFESEDYQRRRGALEEAFQKKQGDAFAQLREKAAQQSVVIVRTPFGFALAPAHNGEVVPPNELAAWPEAKRKQVQVVIEALEKDLEHIVRQVPQWEKEHRDEVRRLNRDTAQFAVSHSIGETKARFADLPKVIAHLDRVQSDLTENAGMFVVKGDGEEEARELLFGRPFDRYEVNVLVSQPDGRGAPIVEEPHPTLNNLIGRIEYVSHQGTLVTNFRLIKSGSIHRANGGYLLIDARSLLLEPFSWAALKRALRQRQITIEDVARFLGLTSTVSLEPDPIPLDVKIVLFGDRLLYFLLAAFDPELAEHFKVLADFEDDVARSPESEAVLARVVASIIRRDGLKPMDRAGVGLLIEHAARLADHAGKLTLLVDQMRDVVTEADFWAGEAGRTIVTRADVQRALDEGIRRAARLRDRAREVILENVALIDSTGSRVGQINGLSVIELGGFRFGRPTRITCRARPGGGKLVDIEREVELGGPIHSKGVLILAGFLAGRYALDTPMSLFASLVFEQSYSGVEGDSASSAELYALMSALAEVPLRQDLAVTGSVNQHGEIQAIGGVNEKIEGFFDICAARGLTGTQGVLIPEANVQHLMLRSDVIDACREGRFAVHAVETIDQGIELLTGRQAGTRDADGVYPPDSINRLVEDRLRAFAGIWRSFGRPALPEMAESPP